MTKRGRSFRIWRRPAPERSKEQYALDMTAASVLEQHKINLHHRIEVTNEAGQDVLTVEFGDVITVER